MGFLSTYFLFLAEIGTLLVASFIVTAVVIGKTSFAKKLLNKNKDGEYIITNLNEQNKALKFGFFDSLLTSDELKEHKKSRKETEKLEADNRKLGISSTKTTKAFILSFNGDTSASGVESLKKEVDCVLSIAKKDDEVLVTLESCGGHVHSYGYASNQLERIREAGLNLTICVDKVAASGGYMMACVANKVIAAPFAIIGSIGVVAGFHNFNKLLEKNGIEYEMHTAGKFKRTLTPFGKNTDEARSKFKEDLSKTHILFKDFICKYRKNIDIESVATGEHWYGQQAIEIGLVDKISTSDSFISSMIKKHEVFSVSFQEKKSFSDKVIKGVSLAFDGIMDTLIEKSKNQTF